MSNDPKQPVEDQKLVRETVTNATNLALAQTEYLDVSRPKPRISVLALKYDISPSYLMRMSIKYDWDGLRNRAEVQAAMQVTPEVRKAVVSKIDGIILRAADGIASKVLTAYSNLIDEIVEMKTEGSAEAAIDEAERQMEESKAKGKKTRKGKKERLPSLSAKVNLLNDATGGVNEFMLKFRELGLTLNPEGVDKKPVGDMKNAIPVTGGTPDIPPPPIESQAQAPESTPDLPPPPPV